MSAAENEVSEAIQEQEPLINEQPAGIDINSAVESIADDLFPHREEKEPEVETTEETPEAEVVEEVTEEPEAIEEDLRDPPQSWKKEFHEKWNALDKETQEYIELRETQMKEGVEVKKEDANLGMRMRDAFSPFADVLEKNNIDPINASQKLMATHLRLATANPEQKQQLFNQLAQSYGVTFEKPEVDEDTQKLMDQPLVKNLINKINQLEQNQNAIQTESQQERAASINEQVEKFASEHDHFDDLSDETAKLIRAGYSLEDAYNVAYRASPFFEQDLEKKREEKEKEAEKARKKEAEKAKKAKSVNVRGRDTGKTPTGPTGTIEDTLRDTMRTIKNRN